MAAFAGLEDGAANPKNELTDEPIDETKDAKGEGIFVAANPSGIFGALKKSATEAFKLVTEDRAVFEIVFVEDRTKGSGGAETSAGSTGTIGATDLAEAGCQFPIKIIGVIKAVSKSKATNRALKLNSHNRCNNPNERELN